MTLIEICLAVALVAMAAGVAVPALGNFSRADLRQSASMLGQKVRESYTLAALGGGTWRMVMSPGSNKVRVERTDEQVRLAHGRGVGLQEDFSRLLSGADGTSFGPDPNAAAAQQALFGGSTALDAGQLLAGAVANPNAPPGPAFADAGVKQLDFKGSVHLLDVWTDGMEVPATEGDVYLYLFPQGYTQNALIHLEDAQKRVFSVRVHALTGGCDIEAGYVEVGK